MGAWCRTWSNRVLLLLAAAALAVFLFGLLRHGMAVRDNPGFRARAEAFFLLLCIVLAFSLLLEVANAWREGLKRKELPPCRGTRRLRARSFRSAGPVRSMTRHCAGELDRHFRRFYAFHHYEAPFTAYFYYAKTGSLSLLSGPWMKVGFLVLFLMGRAAASGGAPWDPPAWETAILAVACLFVISGLFMRATTPYRKIWLRIVEENNLACLTLICSVPSRDPSRDRWFEAFCRSFETQPWLVSCSTQSRYGCQPSTRGNAMISGTS